MSNRDFRMVWSVLFSCATSVVALYLAYLSAVFGHGSYWAAKLFFPYAMLLAIYYEQITLVALFIAVIQFPTYGVILGLVWVRRLPKFIAACLIVIHLLLSSITFLMSEH
jgi:hypothetical protein